MRQHVSKSRSVCALLVAFVMLSLTLLSGCHGVRSVSAFAVPDELDTSRTFDITFWAKNDTNLTQKYIYEKAMSDFMELYPNIHVTMRLYNDYGKIYNDVITNISTGTTPNVCITYPDHIATYLTGENTVVPLDTLFDDEKYGLGGAELLFDSPTKEEIVPAFLSECVLNGAHYAMPYMRSTEACYVNKTYVEALGFTLPDVLTWDFIWEVCEAAMEKDADGNFLLNGQKVMIPLIYKSTDNMMIQMLRQKGAGYSTADGTIEIFNETTEDLLYMIAEHAGRGEFSTFKISSYPANWLNAGRCIFAIDSTAGATWMGADAPLIDISEDKLVRFETEVYPIPQFRPEEPVMISQGPSVCVFNKDDPQEVLASWLFAQYLLTNDVQISYSQTEGYVPVTLKAQNSDVYKEYLARMGEDNDLYYDVKIKASRLLLANTENTFVTPVFNGSVSLRSAAGQMIENVTKSVNRKQTVDEAYLEKLFADMNSLYRLDQISGVTDSRGESDLGPLPGGSVALLVCLGLAWVLIGAYIICEKIKKTKKS